MKKNIVIRMLDRVTTHFLCPIVAFVVAMLVAAAIHIAKQFANGCPFGCIALKVSAVFHQWDAELLTSVGIILLALAYMIRLSITEYRYQKKRGS